MQAASFYLIFDRYKNCRIKGHRQLEKLGSYVRTHTLTLDFIDIQENDSESNSNKIIYIIYLIYIKFLSQFTNPKFLNAQIVAGKEIIPVQTKLGTKC